MSQNLWVLIGKGIAKKIHCCFAVFILLTFVGAAHAAGYTCQSSKRFTSCNTGYYISNCPTSSSSWTGQTISSSALTTGNSCKSCPSGYSCSGGLVCPKRNTVTITLNKNGGYGDIGTGTAIVSGRLSATITCTAGAACALPEWSSNVSASAKNTNITNGSKVFVGWATTSTATAGSFTIKSTTNRTLYAVWKTPTCSATNGSCTIQNASENRPTAKITCSTGYSLNGGLAGGDIYLITGFIAYGTAGETEVSGSCLANCNTITFNSTQNGGSGGWSTKLYKKTGSTKWFANSTCSVVRTAAITKPTKTNATFAGFYNTSAASGGTQFISSTGALLTTSGLTVTAPTTLYAQYECNTGYTGTGTRISGKCNPIGLTITLNKNGGSGILKTDEDQTNGTASARMLCYYNQPCTLPSWDDTNAEHRNNITNGQKIFTGWSTTPTVREGDTGVFTMTFTANDVVYAVWIQPTCTVTGGHGTCIIANSVLNRPTAIFGCDTGYVDSNDSGNTSWEAYGASGATSVVDECVAAEITCAAGKYLSASTATCTTCESLYFCPGGTFTYTDGDDQGMTHCPTTNIDQTDAPWHFNSDPGSTAVNECYVYGNATEFSDNCAAGQWRLYYDSSSGNYTTFKEHSTVTAKPGAYVDDSNHTFPTCTQCTGATYSAGGDVHSCLTCPTIYTDNTTAGKSSANQCQVRTDGGYYIATAQDDEQTQCTTKHYCPSALVNYGSTNSPVACPDPETHARTTYPDSYYDPTLVTVYLQSWGGPWKSETECLVTYNFTNSRGAFNVESTGYNAETKQYDRGGSIYYNKINAGYYANQRLSATYCDNGTYMYYRESLPCPADSYCPGFTSMPLCSSGEYTETNGINACPSGYLDNEELRKTAISQCQREVSSKVYIATAGGTTPSICPAGSACPGGMLGYGDIGPINKCTGATYSLDSSASCSDCPAGYDDDLSDGKTRQTACKISVPAGDYMDVPGGTTIKECTTKHYCPGGMVGYGSKLEPTACPDPETHAVTASELPDKFYDATILYTSVQAWFTGGEPWTKETDCRAVYSLDNSRGHLITDNVVYNASTKKYDQFIRWPYYVSINPGYYANSKYDEARCDNDNNTMLYKDAQPCPAGSYCPGLTSMPSCTSGTYNDTLGINACPANYGTSPAQSTANTQCYLTTTAGKWVATKNAAQTSCTAGGFCVGGVKVNYGSTGGRTPAAAGYYVSTTGATTQTACAAGTYTSTTGQTKCTDAVAGTYTTGCKITSNNTACTGTAVCATNTYSDARASVCIACNTTNGYKNIGTDKSAHAGIASCKVYCSDGQYVPVAGDGCVDVGVGYWGVGGGVAQNATLARNACASGLTTIGFGLGANEAGDCGRVLNVGDEKIYLRSTKKTTPSLNISINGDVFYGNMSTATSGGSSLRINSGGATYRVYDDSNPALPHSGGDLD